MLLYYDCITEFKKQFFKNLLTAEHVDGTQIQLNKLRFPGGGSDDNADFWGYVLKKDGIKYLLPSKNNKKEDIPLKSMLPLQITSMRKVASNKEVYYLIDSFEKKDFKSLQSMSFKVLVDKLSYFKHSNPDHQKLNWFLAFTQMLDRANMRVCSPPGFGKDSTVDIFGNLVGGCHTIVNPTLAKLEFMTFYKWLAVNEVVDLGGAEWRNIELFLLDAGAFKPEIPKHSRAIGNVKEVLNISHFSLTLLYNDISDYPDMKTYFDFMAKQAVLDRFPPFRLYGRILEDFNQIKNVSVTDFVREHFDDYKALIYNITYYKEHLQDLLHGWTCTMPSGLSERWKINISKILRFVDLYCESQSEFDKWSKVLFESINDYKAMLSFPIESDKIKRKKAQADWIQIQNEMRNKGTYLEKIQYLKDTDSKKVVEESYFA